MRLRNILILLAILLVVGGYFYFSSIPKPATKPEAQLFVWMIEMDDLQHIEIRLPLEGKSEAFIKEADRLWYFDDLQRSSVNMTRWGGGIPLLLSGPGVDRVIAKNATEEKLAEFGLTQPRMEIALTLTDKSILNIKVGDNTPSSNAFYIQVPDSNDVAIVDITWYQVIERLVIEPPYASATGE